MPQIFDVYVTVRTEPAGQASSSDAANAHAVLMAEGDGEVSRKPDGGLTFRFTAAAAAQPPRQLPAPEPQPQHHPSEQHGQHRAKVEPPQVGNGGAAAAAMPRQQPASAVKQEEPAVPASAPAASGLISVRGAAPSPSLMSSEGGAALAGLVGTKRRHSPAAPGGPGEAGPPGFVATAAEEEEPGSKMARQ